MMPRGGGISSTSSVWGSAGAHFTQYGDRRFLLDVASVPESKLSLKIDNNNDMLSGSRNVVCSTEAEQKANKLNRSEQTKLESIQRRVTKEKETCQRRFRQIETAFRAKSAKLIDRSKSVDSRRPSSLRSNWKPVAFVDKPPSSSSSSKSQRCELCDKIQEVMDSYAIEAGKRSDFEHYTDGDHSVCMFSDTQVHNFLDVLRAEYLKEVPDLQEKLRINGIVGTQGRENSFKKRSREEIDYTLSAKDIEGRIRQFCKELDKYNKENGAIPKEVRDMLEKIRIAGAIATPRIKVLSSRSRMKQEVQEMLTI